MVAMLPLLFITMFSYQQCLMQGRSSLGLEPLIRLCASMDTLKTRF